MSEPTRAQREAAGVELAAAKLGARLDAFLSAYMSEAAQWQRVAYGMNVFELEHSTGKVLVIPYEKWPNQSLARPLPAVLKVRQAS